MSYNLRLRRVAYDNIAVGSVTGIERHKGTNSTEILARENIAAPDAPSTYRTTNALDLMLNEDGNKTTQYVNETIINTN
jgi:hypothetical protein